MKNTKPLIINEKLFFQRLPQYKRKKYLSQMLQTCQLKKQPTKIYLSQHQSPCNPFPYKSFTLNYHKVTPYFQPKAILFWFHGINGHAGNYAYVSNNVASQLEINVYLLDLMNFGRSQGNQRGCINSFEECLDQAQRFVEFVLGKYQHKPKVFLGGHSIGGTICFHMTLRRPNLYFGVVFFAPGLRDMPNLKVVKHMVKVFGYFFPTTKTISSRFQSSNRYDCTTLFQQDPYNYLDRLILGSFRVALNAIDLTSTLFHKFSAPYIVFQGGTDKIVDPFAPIDLQRKCKSKDKTTVYFRDMWHSIPFEEQIGQIVQIMIAWLKERI